VTWNLAEAKNRLSELVNLALEDGPQIITRRRDSVVVLSAQRYAELTGAKPGFKDFLFAGPTFEGLDLERDQSPSRDVVL
jgi:prevent-host-death family protein